MAKGKIRVRIKGYDTKVVDESTSKIVDTAIRTGAKVAGPVPLPTKMEKITVISGPHIDKRSGEHFEVRTHVRLIDILEPTVSTIDQLSHLSLPSGVGIEISA
ncbi:MAG: 30S ribosomal protein S10 [Patescibacteria group bacterium]|nr:30S ribosomal protein S10 [Patescibacteria group bacterium]